MIVGPGYLFILPPGWSSFPSTIPTVQLFNGPGYQNIAVYAYNTTLTLDALSAQIVASI